MDSHQWFKSSLSSGNGNCVEVHHAANGDTYARDSKDPDGPVLIFHAGEWDAFIASAKAGEFDRDRATT